MKILSIAVLVTSLALPGVANAACGPTKLAGSWLLAMSTPSGSTSTCTISITSAGVLSAASSCLGVGVTGKLFLSSTCRLTGTILSQTFAGRTEALDPTSTVAPNLMVGTTSGFLGTIAVAAFRK